MLSENRQLRIKSFSRRLKSLRALIPGLKTRGFQPWEFRKFPVLGVLFILLIDYQVPWLALECFAQGVEYVFVNSR